jgi:nitronate monooxygenase
MAVPNASRDRLDIPVVAAPMLLVSGPDPVVETCRAGALGTFPALNQRTYDGHASRLNGIEERLEGHPRAAPFDVHPIVHRSNARLRADLETTAAKRVPVVIAGAVQDLGAAGEGSIPGQATLSRIPRSL